MRRILFLSSFIALLLAGGLVPAGGKSAVPAPAALAPAASDAAAPATAAPVPVLIGTFQPDVSGGACAVWDAGCARTALRLTARRASGP